MSDIMLQIANQFGYIGFVFLMSLEIGSELILPFAGYLVHITDLTLIGVIIATTIGSVIGAVILYWIGYFFSKERIVKMFDNKLGHFFHLDEKNITKAENWFTRYEGKAVFFGRLLPIVRGVISVPAGMTHMNFGYYLVLTTIGNTIWNVVLIYVGYLLGSAWETFAHQMELGSKIIAGILVAIVLGYIIYTIIQNRKESKKTK